VIGDCVNDWTAARDGWRDAGLRACADVVWLEIVCSDPAEHRRRVETRTSDIAGLDLPDWRAVTTQDYHPWDYDHLTIDTAHKTVDACVEAVLSQLDGWPGPEVRQRPEE
jgi:hypothetical protein